MPALTFEAEDLKPLVTEIVRQVLRELEATRATLPTDKPYLSEPEAARLLGLKLHNLRDARRRKEIQASRVCGRRIRYAASDLAAYMARTRINQEN